MLRSSAFVAALVAAAIGATMPSMAPAATPLPATAGATAPVSNAIIDRLERLKAARGRGAIEKWHIEMIAAYYRGREFAPLWTANGQLNDKAAAAIDEIRRAADFGLDPAAFDLPRVAGATFDAEQLADAEARLSVAVVRYAWHAAGGRIDPVQLSKWLDQTPRTINPAAALKSVSTAADPAAAVRALNPQHPTFERLRQAYVTARGTAPAVIENVKLIAPGGPKLRPGDDHPDIVLIRQRLGVDAPGEDLELYDEALARAVRAFRREIGRPVNSVIDDRVRAALNRRDGGREAAPAKNPALARKLLVNMERWRWLPENLGPLYIWNNLPEYEMRVVKSGKIAHRERIIIGKPETQTPVFSDQLRMIVFQPNWGVPPSIKVRSLLPRLQDGDESVLSGRNMRIVVNGKTMDPTKYNWDKTDIRTVPIIQDPGPDNPLGQIKFLFPNKHDVYMHDTPSKGLFNQSTRALSNGCIRVRNPRRLAEIVFAEDRGWVADDISALMTPKAIINNRIDLTQRVPVHNVYFTATIDDDGRLKLHNDVYEHDSRITDALDGRPIAEIAVRDPARQLEEELEEIAPTLAKKKARG